MLCFARLSWYYSALGMLKRWPSNLSSWFPCPALSMSWFLLSERATQLRSTSSGASSLGLLRRINRSNSFDSTKIVPSSLFGWCCELLGRFQQKYTSFVSFVDSNVSIHVYTAWYAITAKRQPTKFIFRSRTCVFPHILQLSELRLAFCV